MTKIRNICALLGKRVRDERRRQNFTQEELSEKMDVTTEFVSRIERGIGIPSLETFIKLAKALNVSLDSLVADNETDSVQNQMNFLLVDLSKKQKTLAVNIMTQVIKEIKKEIK